MRILYASERPPYPFFLGGAVRCAHMLLQGLSRDLATDCRAVGSSEYAVTPWSFPSPDEYEALGIRGSGPPPMALLPLVGEGTQELDCGYPVRLLPDFFNALGPFIDACRPDLVWAQMEGAREILEIARRNGVPGLYFVHDAEFDPEELRAIVAMGCRIVCGSGFLARKVLLATGCRAHVVYPPAELYFGERGDPDGYVTMINAHKVKGLETFLEVARRLPRVRFLLQESWKLKADALAALQVRLTELPNVTFQHRVSDMRQVYRKTRLLLAPSVWEEGFGMVAVEAQSCGIPVIASARGGLPESVGDGGLLIKDYRNVDDWVAAVRSVLEYPERYADLSARALAHARSNDFSPPELARRFLAACQAPAPGVGMMARAMRAWRRGVAGVRRWGCGVD
jgi:glycosyltransferase involved in cell wall biosynthesis